MMKPVTFEKIALCSVISVLCINPAMAQKIAVGEPEFYSEIALEASRDKDKQIDIAFTELRFGVKGEVQTPVMNILYDAEVDLHENANADEDSRALGKKAREVEVRTAKFTIPNSWGTIIAGKMNGREAAADVYGGVDIFERNTMPLFFQPQTSARLYAYVTPVVAGGLYGALAFQTLDDSTGKDMDAEAIVGVYRAENWRIAGSHIRVVKGYGGLGGDYYRNALGVNYAGSDWQVSAVYEENNNHYGDDVDIYTIAGKKSFGDFDIALGYANRDNKGPEPASYDALKSSDEATIVNITQNLSDDVKVWLEYGAYEVGPNNTSIGLQVKF